ncbi:MAG TPA: prepilin-type N-terminal cleavage/methylation domain-containing protein [Candidatus Dormibacteraeota bacterium]|nr:prepilin-type N-terminal cleavage/methylation domain-containing protein [Candidatus Dormibacteraeota bacterium]
MIPWSNRIRRASRVTCDYALQHPPSEAGGIPLGFSLVELLVAIAVFALAIAVALAVYSGATRSYRTGEQQVLDQQNVRLGFDRLVSEIGLAGFNSNPDGDLTRPDEQIEGAWDTAITFRADLDSDRSPENTVPELALAPPHYRIVSIGNDEIVSYVLAKPQQQHSNSLALQLDADEPRSKIPRTIIVPVVSLVHDEPPYTLYRVTLRNTGGLFPSAPQAPSNFLFESIADNIRSLTLQYYDHEGRLLSPGTPQDPVDDIGGGDTGIVTRARIRSIKITLTGMPPQESSESGKHPVGRRVSRAEGFSLSSMITPGNLGRVGIADTSTQAPVVPKAVRAVAGHCRSVLVTWEADEPHDDIRGFDIRYWEKGVASEPRTKAFSYPSVQASGIDHHLHGYLTSLTEKATYCFQVRTRFIPGGPSNWSSASAAPCVQVTDATTPRAPVDLVATGGAPHTALANHIELQWSPVVSNTMLIPDDLDVVDHTTVIRDLNGYKLYRASTPGFIPSDSGNLIATIGAGTSRYVDHDVANCLTYYYRLIAVDNCAVTSVASLVAEGRAETSVSPSAPVALTVFRLSEDQTALSWKPVRSDLNGGPVFIDQYRIYLYRSISDLSTSNLNLKTFSLRAAVDSASPSYNDVLDVSEQSDIIRGWQFYYAVTAADRCGNESGRSDPGGLSCKVEAVLDLTPRDGDSGSGIIPMILRPDTRRGYPRARVRVVRKDDLDSVVYDHQSAGVPFLFPTWDTRVSGAGDYRIYWGLTTAEGCNTFRTTDFFVKSRPEGGLSTTTPLVITTEENRKLSWDLVNTSGTDLQIVRIDVNWFSLRLPPRLTSIEYPTRTTVSSLPSGGPQSASATFDTTPLRLSREINGLCEDESCRLNMSLVWDEPVFSGQSLSAERVTVHYHLRDSTGRTGDAVLVIWPDMTIRMALPIGFNVQD